MKYEVSAKGRMEENGVASLIKVLAIIVFVLGGIGSVIIMLQTNLVFFLVSVLGVAISGGLLLGFAEVICLLASLNTQQYGIKTIEEKEEKTTAKMVSASTLEKKEEIVSNTNAPRNKVTPVPVRANKTDNNCLVCPKCKTVQSSSNSICVECGQKFMNNRPDVPFWCLRCGHEGPFDTCPECGSSSKEYNLERDS